MVAVVDLDIVSNCDGEGANTLMSPTGDWWDMLSGDAFCVIVKSDDSWQTKGKASCDDAPGIAGLSVVSSMRCVGGDQAWTAFGSLFGSSRSLQQLTTGTRRVTEQCA
jgi:hypothetical protein